MASKDPRRPNDSSANRVSSPIDEMLLQALERGDESAQTGRFLVTFKEGAADEGEHSLGARNLRVASARDYDEQAVALETTGDADAVVFPEIGVALVGGRSSPGLRTERSGRDRRR